MKPWEKYAQQPAEGPWTKYAKKAEPVEQAPAQERTIGQRLYDNIIGDPNDGVDSFGERAGRTLNDMGRAAGAGLVRGAAGIADLPGAAFGAGATAGSWLAESLGLADEGEAKGARSAVQGMAIQRMGDGSTARNALADITGGASEFRGNTTAGQYAGTVGEFLPGAFGGGGAVRNALTYGVVPGLASEAAGQATEGTAAEPWARTIAPIIAGGVAGLATRPKGPQAPTKADQRAQAEGLYRAGDARPGADATAVSDLAKQVDAELLALNIKTPTGRIVADGNVKKFLDVMDDYAGQDMTPEQMQTVRRMLQDAAGSADPQDRRIGAALLGKFDDWRRQHVPEYDQADKIYGRMKRADDVDFRIEKAERRAASSGTGGNSVNTARQNIRQILDDPKKQRGYSEDELIAMERIVRGSPVVNTLRLGGRLSPTSGALPLIGSIAGTGLNPLAGAAMMGATYAMKSGAEALTNRQINNLSAMIRNGAALPKNALAGLDDASFALLATRAAMAAQERQGD